MGTYTEKLSDEIFKGVEPYPSGEEIDDVVTQTEFLRSIVTCAKEMDDFLNK